MFNSREDIIALTPQWQGERFPNGRPRVSVRYLEKMRTMTPEELWKPIFVKDYESRFEGIFECCTMTAGSLSVAP